MTVQAHVKDRILVPRDEVFEAIVNPDRLAGFFISGASDRLREGKTVHWTFDDVGAALDVEVQTVRPDQIAFSWDASGAPAQVDILLTDEGNRSTLIDITEQGWPDDDHAVDRALGQTAGWTDFVCCMKAYLQHGINLREGRTASAVH